ncbi:phage major capsid protein, P2 family [Pseudomonas sp. FSL R10-1339]|uniref:phage major capsid protein, P2 family n=1 Tax=Pseudomonas sp. FSL R10-1339 TaxID=2662196 RepID=UPI0012957BA0|nr:phage major capsid protein, P2 family [Pseudomonas sp. FSL R10-1339]MQU55054.1 phage major capsid protein, P2 family [Pseudomonas sp. FSL R10-1339]
MTNSNGTTKYAILQQAFAKVYNAPKGASSFTIEPSAAQSINEKITAKSDFLERINIVPVSEIKGEKVMFGVTGPVTGRTDIRIKEREVKDFSSLENNTYELSSTESDVSLPYAKIDSWAKFPDFHKRYSDAVQKQIALDRMMIGFRGTHNAAQTDIETFPMLEDVNKGWLQQAREKVPSQVLSQGLEAGKISLGEGGDYANLDALVYDVTRLIDDNLRDSDLIAIIGSDLLAHDKAVLYAKQAGTPTEKERIESAQVVSTYGGVPSFSVPFFPVNAVLVTSWDNLSIYFQDTSWRVLMLENPKRNRVEDYNSRNEGYVVEQFGKIALAENVELV